MYHFKKMSVEVQSEEDLVSKMANAVSDHITDQLRAEPNVKFNVAGHAVHGHILLWRDPIT